MHFTKLFSTFLVAVGVMMPIQSPMAQTNATDTSKSIAIQLNNTVTNDGVCRLSFMVRNGLEVPLSDLGIEIVLLDKQGMAQDFMMLRASELTAGKRRILQFDLPGVGCGDLSEILINDVSDCKADGMTPASCLAALEPSSLTAVKLGL
ncbi:hypothetical protein [uncultured Cohaesibacter sp.]|uniref:hypothetical protein n=1 Tax=uncultured Cohaesibacter sp. TaxID=1002546 RepID=UPI0029C71835|nr:hypothetical protein [uncultured Cohaesibacter sp.]